ncbi:MAG: HAMP domain-containing protein [Actinobacteria bacterium]|nr:HAMP domain-containing protein [Actinomycetota bacterium]
MSTRLLLALAYVLVLAIVALEVPLAFNLRDRVDAEVGAQAGTATEAIAAVAGEPVAARSLKRVALLVDLPAESARGRVVIVDEGGEVLADSANGYSVGANLANRPEVARALTGESVQFSRRSDTLGTDLIATSAPIYDDGKLVGAVRVTQDVKAQKEAVNRSIAGLTLVGLVVLVTGLVAGWFIARQIAQPLRRFEATARAVAEGDLEARAPIEGSDEQRSLARTFNEMTDRLSKSLRAQSRFVADASHQLRTPLTGLRLRLEEALAEAEDPAVRADIEKGIDEVDRLARTVEELLVLSQTGERDSRSESVDLGELVRRAGERWLPIAADAGHDLNVVVNGASSVTASPADLDRVLDALIENAVNYSAPGRGVELVIARGEVTIRDYGPGLDGESPEELFERFHRGRAGAQRSGTGLGLAIARELAARWGGEVELADAPGDGAVATLSFGARGEPGAERHDERETLA